MCALRTEQTQSLQTRQEFKLIARVEQANLLEMPEKEFSKLISQIENSPLFRRIHQEKKLIRYQRYPGTGVSSSVYQLNEDIAADMGTFDVESLLLNKEDIVRQVQKIGLENFKRYFLYPELEVSLEEIARECNLEPSEVGEINSLVDEFSILSEFYHPSALSSAHGICYSKVASVEKGPEGFVIGYFSPSLARGRYSIDYERFEELREGGAFGGPEVKEIRQLFSRLELINSRKDTMTRILQEIVEKQALYFQCGDLKALLPVSQRELAKRIGVVPSSISRAIRGRSVETPWGEEKALKDFFPRPRRFKKELVRRLLETEEELLSDEAIRAKLEHEFGVSISRRSVASLRKELRIPPMWRRGKIVSEEAKGG